MRFAAGSTQGLPEILAIVSRQTGYPPEMLDVELDLEADLGVDTVKQVETFAAVVNFRGPLVFCVISRYHGGAFVVFSAKLNDGMEVAALEGSYASVIGGAPAAAVVFAREVEKRARRDPRLAGLEEELARAEGPARARLRERYDALLQSVHAEMLGRVADEFDRVHSVQRAQKMGSVHRIISPATLRPYLISAIERGLERARAG